MKKKIPITLLTGYLGAGKTTLLNYVLKNQKNYKVAVIVNDIGEVNVDASLIENNGIVSGKDGNLVALSNGCICCTLKVDLIKQIADIYKMNKFDYILIEASGICEPIPIAQTITMLDGSSNYDIPDICRLDNIVSIVDAKRMVDEFFGGDSLLKSKIDEDDIENLLVQQIEFCNTIVLNKVDEISKKDKDKIIHVIKALQPQAKIIETNYGKVELNKIFDTKSFDFAKAGMSAGWVKALLTEEEKEPETDEYGISTFVYKRLGPFSQDKFESFINDNYPKSIIRTKGMLWFHEYPGDSCIFEQSGSQMAINMAGRWIATQSEARQKQYRREHPDKHWDKKYGDRIIKLVIIGKNMDKDKIIKALDDCIFEKK